MGTIDNKFIEEASKKLSNQVFDKLKKCGYYLSHGYQLKKEEPEIVMIAQYMSPLRFLYRIGSKKRQEKVAEIVPSQFYYKGIKIPVKLEFISSGKFYSK